MAERTSRGPLLVAGCLLAVSSGVLIVAAATGSWNAAPHSRTRALPVRIDGLPASKIYLDLNLTWTNAASKLTIDEARASHVSGLATCAPDPPDTSSMPAPPGFYCLANDSFSIASLDSLERLPAVQEIGASTARRHFEGLYFLGVQRGQWALITEPVKPGASAIYAELATLRETPSVIRCGLGRGGPFLGYEIACSTTSHTAAEQVQEIARHFDAAFAEVIRW